MSDWDMGEAAAPAATTEAGDDWDAAAPAAAQPDLVAAKDVGDEWDNGASIATPADGGDADPFGAASEDVDMHGAEPVAAGADDSWGAVAAAAASNDYSNAYAGTADAAVDDASPSLFVGNLSWHVNETVLRAEFGEFGEITSARVVSDPDTGRSKGFGYVDFTNSADAAKAMAAKNGAMMDGREIRIDFAQKKDKPQRSGGGGGGFGGGGAKNPESDTLFVGGLSYDATEEVVREAFSAHGAVNEVRIPKDRATQQSKGFAYVSFPSIDDARTAFEKMNGEEIAGRNIRLDYAVPRHGGGGGGAGGASGPQNPESDTIFVGGLSEDATEDVIREAFSAHGVVNEVRLPMDQATQKTKGFGYVTFNSVDDARNAFEKMNGADIAGRNIRLDYAAPKNGEGGGGGGGFGGGGAKNPEGDTLFVGGISDEATEDIIREAFSAHGAVNEVRVPMDQDTQQPKGIAYVSFHSVDDARNAFEKMNGEEIAGRSIRLDYAAVRDRPAREPREVSAPTNPESDTLFVGSVSDDVTEELLTEAFGVHGTITSLRIPTDQDTGAHKGFAYVTFSSVDEAVAALTAMNGMEICGRNIRLDYAAAREPRAPREPREVTAPTNEPSNTLFVGSISFSATEEIFREAFGEHGTVTSVRIPTDMESGEPKGFAYVSFATVDDAVKAVEALNGADIAGRNIRLDFAAARDGPPKGGGSGNPYFEEYREPLDPNKPLPPRAPDVAHSFDPHEAVHSRNRERNTHIAAEINVPDRFELFLLQDGEKKITEAIDTRTPNSSIFTILKEDHTLCNLLRAHLLKDPAVLFAGYKIPHPLFAKVELRVQTDGSITPKEAVITCSKKLVSDLGQFSREFTKEYELRKMVNNASAPPPPPMQNGANGHI